MFNEIENCDEIYEIIKSIDMNDSKKYAKVLLELEDWCLDNDPILIEEFWADIVSDFLKHLTENA